MNCNYTTCAIYLLTLVAYKYSELQVSNAIQKLKRRASYKTPLFFIMYLVIPYSLLIHFYSIQNLIHY